MENTNFAYCNKKNMITISNTKQIATKSYNSFFLFGKWPDFEDADTLRGKAWKRNFISKNTLHRNDNLKYRIG
jgi:hypothetical protein